MTTIQGWAIYGTSDDELLQGGDSSELLSGGAGNDELSGSGGNDTIDGGTGNDTLYGGYGSDTLDGGTGNDYLHGGDEDSADTYLFSAGSGQDTVAAEYSNGSVEPDTICFGEGIAASSITLSRAPASLSLKLSVGGSTDSLTLENYYGGRSNVQVVFADGTVWDRATLESMTVRVEGTVASDYDNGVINPELVNGNAGNDELSGGQGDDTLNGGTGNDTLYGGAGNDTLDGGMGADTMAGSAGDDTYVVDSAVDAVTEDSIASGIDVVLSSVNWTLGSYLENLVLTGSAAVNGTGNALANMLTGNGAANVLDGGTGADTMAAGAGDDTYVVDNVNDVVAEEANAGSDTVKSSVSWVLSDNLENLVLTGDKAINGTGNSLANTLTGNTGANVVDGGTGADTMSGGTGDDTYIVDNLADVVIESSALATEIDTVKASVDWTLSAHLENLVLLGAENLAGMGNELSNVITGNVGANVLDGGMGADTLDGGAGADTLIGSAGSDVYMVDNLGDVVKEESASGESDTVKSSVSWTLGANLENLVLTSSTAIDGTGNALANALTGNAAANVLDGGTGADTMAGGAGNDTYVVDNAKDVVTEAANAGTDTVKSSVSWVLRANLEHLVLTGTAAINGTGNALGNKLTGNAAANVLDGGTGADTLDGGASADTLIGGAGSDTYVVDDFGDVVKEESAAGESDTVKSSVSWTLGVNLENLVLTDNTAISGMGNALANALTGNAVANVLDGGAGNDTIDGGAGNDTVQGAEGSDTYLFGRGDGQDTILSRNDAVLPRSVNTLQFESDVLARDVVLSRVGDALLIKLSGSADQITVENFFWQNNPANTENPLQQIKFANGTTWDLAQIEARIPMTGTQGADAIFGTVNSQVISGLAGADRIEGRGGKDTLLGGAGNDTIVGGDGNDSIFGGAGGDLIEAGGGNDTIDGGAGNDTVQGAEGSDTYLFGRGDGQDTILSRNDAVLPRSVNTLQFESDVLARDVMLSRVGDALLIKLSGSADQITVENFFWQNNPANTENPLQQIKFANGTTWDLAQIEARIPMTGTQGADAIFGTVNSQVISGLDSTEYELDGNNVFYSAEDKDLLNGRANRELADGGEGNDKNSSGACNDVFHFSQALVKSKTYTFTELNHVDDRLELDYVVFAQLDAMEQASAGAFVLGNKTLDAADQLICDHAAGQLFYDNDGTDTHAAMLITKLGAGTNLAADDLFVV